MKKPIQLSDHFTYSKLLRFTVPSIAMMILVCLYNIVDALFVSNLVGEMALAAVNVTLPVIYIMGAIGHLIGAGGSAVLGRTLGEGKRRNANQYLTLFVMCSIAITILLSVICIVFLRPILCIAGASELLMKDCLIYGKILLIAMPFCVLQVVFSKFLVVMEKPEVGLWVSVTAGITNVVLDYLFIAVFQWGVAGAALATAIGYIMGGCIPILYVLFNKTLNLQFAKTRILWKAIGQAIYAGLSAMINSLSSTIVGILLNVQLMAIAGENGVAAYGILMQMDFIFMGIFNGFSNGIAPVISYNHGSHNYLELNKLIKKSILFISLASIFSMGIEQMLATGIARLFVSKSPEIMAITVQGFRIFAFVYLFAGTNVFAAAFFSAISNGKLSFILSMLRAVILKSVFVLVLPVLFELKGIWLSIVLADALPLLLSMILLRKTNKELVDHSGIL